MAAACAAKLRFQNRVSVGLPVRLATGTGNADLRLQWDSKGLAANLVCGDVDVTKAVTGGVVPQDYRLGGAFKIASSGNSVTLSPDFPTTPGALCGYCDFRRSCPAATDVPVKQPWTSVEVTLG